MPSETLELIMQFCFSDGGAREMYKKCSSSSSHEALSVQALANIVFSLLIMSKCCLPCVHSYVVKLAQANFLFFRAGLQIIRPNGSSYVIHEACGQPRGCFLAAK